MFGKLFGMFVLMMLTFLGALYLGKTYVMGSGLEGIALVVGVIIALTVIFGLFAESRWAWALSTIFFSLALADLSWVYFNGNEAFLIYLASAFFAFVGLMVSILSIESSVPAETGSQQIQSPPEPQIEPRYEELLSAAQPDRHSMIFSKRNFGKTSFGKSKYLKGRKK